MHHGMDPLAYRHVHVPGCGGVFSCTPVHFELRILIKIWWWLCDFAPLDFCSP